MEKITCINGKVLKWARESSGTINTKLFDDKLDKIKQWEEGLDYPTYAQLETLAEIYRKPLAVFFFPEPPQGFPISANFRTTSLDELNNLPYKFIRVINDAVVMQINVKELNNYKNPAKIILTDLFPHSNIDVDVSTIELRKILNISLDMQKSVKTSSEMFEIWRDALYNYGIYVFKAAFEDTSISGFCLHDNTFPIIYVNNTMSFSRQIFTLFHEVYHLLNKTGGLDKLIDNFSELNEYQKGIELCCNNFAGEFLVPEKDLFSSIENEKIDYDLICNLADSYKVSRESIMVKLRMSGKISQEFFEKEKQDIYRDFFRTSKSKGGNFYNTLISYLGKHYLSLAFDKYTKGNIDEYSFAQYTKIKVDKIPSLEKHWGWKY